MVRARDGAKDVREHEVDSRQNSHWEPQRPCGQVTDREKHASRQADHYSAERSGVWPGEMKGAEQNSGQCYGRPAPKPLRKDPEDDSIGENGLQSRRTKREHQEQQKVAHGAGEVPSTAYRIRAGSSQNTDRGSSNRGADCKTDYDKGGAPINR